MIMASRVKSQTAKLFLHQRNARSYHVWAKAEQIPGKSGCAAETLTAVVRSPVEAPRGPSRALRLLKRSISAVGGVLRRLNSARRL